ncbi:MAG: AAA family ATPase [Dehalobacterium sp.]
MTLIRRAENFMIILPNYVILRQVHENNRIQIFKGYTTAERMPVIIKALKKEAANPIEMAKLIHEYEITRDLNIDGIIRPMRLERAKSFLALVMEDIGAISLKKYVQEHPLKLPDFLNIAIQLTQALDRLHQKGIIHRDLKPENILIHPAAGKGYIIDFSCALLLSLEKKNVHLLNNPVGTLEYMPPEQTGRLNLTADQRSDLYSLGVILYELTTGQLPLQGKNPAELIYAHITQKPEPPGNVNSDIPPILSDIIMKLLAKAVEERYQSAYGLYWDLKECMERLVKTGDIGFFPIGRVDVSSCFHLLDKLYGREREQEALEAAFNKVCKGKAGTFLVSGYPGVGKTMLISKSFKPEAMKKGYFIKGKVDQIKKNIPYAPFAAAFGNLISQIMTESQEELDRWKKRILLALGRSGAVITEIIPELEWIIGEQLPVDVLPPKEAENRFLMVFRHFTRVFTRKGHPLVLFLDDLHWADPASIHLLKYLSQNGELDSLLIIGAFRQNEINEGHPLVEMLKENGKGNFDYTHLLLRPLEWDQILKLVTDTLHCEQKTSAVLAQVLYRKTGGNPFFIRQFLTIIHDEGLLFFNRQDGCWQWELEAIQKLQPGEDVLELLLKRLQRLPGETRETMKLAACIGNSFDLETLAAVEGRSLEETASCLMPSVQEGLVMTADNQKGDLCSTGHEMIPSVFEFLHDRIQQAVDSLMPEDEKKGKHIAIGRLLLQNTLCSSLDEKILSIMDHFNHSLELIDNPAERIELAGYNLLAGRKAKASAAYASALQYFRSGMALLPDDAWEQAYRLSYDLHLELAQAEYLSANVKLAEEMFDIVIEKAGTELERASVYGLKVILYAGMGKYTEAAQTGIRALANLGVKVPVHPGKLDYARELLLFKWNMRNKEIEDLLLMPELHDPVQMKIAELMLRLSSVTISSNQDLYGLMLLKAGNHATRYGNSVSAPAGYFGYSFTSGCVLGDYRAGERFGKVCIQLVERYGQSFFKCSMYFVVGAFISHWTRHAKFGLEYLKKAVRTGMEAGDVLIIGYAHCLILELHYLLGVSLEEMAEEIQNKHEIAVRLKHENFAFNVLIYEKAVSALLGRKSDSLASGAEKFQKGEVLSGAEHDQSSLVTFYFCKMQLHYLAGEYKSALTAAQKGESFSKAILGFMLSSEYCFYYSLVITAIYYKLSFWDQKRLWIVLKKNQRQMKKWAEACQENFRHKYLLIAAEIARLQNKKLKAMSLYDQAIRSARENRYIQNEALANDLAARFYLSHDLEKVARTYMLDAYRGYNRWGALAKVKELRDRYPELLKGIILEEKKDNSNEIIDNLFRVTSSGHSEIASSIEIHTIEKAVESISKETDLNKLLKSFLDIAVQNIGADKGYLILENSGELFIEAAKDSNSSVTVVKTVSLKESHQLSKSIVRYVARTLETIVLNCREETGIFAADPYIAEADSISIACLPLLFQGIPFGVLYIENSLISGVFTSDRLEALKLLSAQVACVKKIQSYLEETTLKDKEKTTHLLIDPLTERETEVLNLIAEGMSNKEIADKLEITLNTVKGYIKNIYEKLGVNRRVQAVTRAKELKLLRNN